MQIVEMFLFQIVLSNAVLYLVLVREVADAYVFSLCCCLPLLLMTVLLNCDLYGRIVRDPRFERLPCLHKGTYADDCLVERVTAVREYFSFSCLCSFRILMVQFCFVLFATDLIWVQESAMRQQYSQWLCCLGTAFLPTRKNTEIRLLYGSLNMLPCHAQRGLLSSFMTTHRFQN